MSRLQFAPVNWSLVWVGPVGLREQLAREEAQLSLSCFRLSVGSYHMHTLPLFFLISPSSRSYIGISSFFAYPRSFRLLFTTITACIGHKVRAYFDNNAVKTASQSLRIQPLDQLQTPTWAGPLLRVVRMPALPRTRVHQILVLLVENGMVFSMAIC
ncbi:hypothetical protein AJ78_07123 [Emergomyces pasteurianus Ep9510]|uniref:Uncharacterized protein n=1 Tax=Emergomyces pasteurianus Ep9510 TaxID=1447872 RepID=A0A1J9QAQ5_9EURO|nr:hypothetical protein AJ78_07123 [Emergomyces pasteurianus Ep9510]